MYTLSTSLHAFSGNLVAQSQLALDLALRFPHVMLFVHVVLQCPRRCVSTAQHTKKQFLQAVHLVGVYQTLMTQRHVVHTSPGLHIDICVYIHTYIYVIVEASQPHEHA